MLTVSRTALLAGADPGCAGLLERLVRNATGGLRLTLTDEAVAFTLAGTRRSDGRWQVVPAGRSRRYATIAALGLLRLGEQDQRAVLGGEDCHDLVSRLAKRLDTMTSLADVALLCWAAAEAGHSELPHALARLGQLDGHGGPVEVVTAAWTVSALVAARPHADVERKLAMARQRLLSARGILYPHLTGGGSWYRAHLGSFADQIYPVQALARLHASADDPAALAAAGSVAAAICAAQGEAGQWWWHYDARTGAVVEGYPVYSVHQHAMAPMALLDLADAGGECHLAAICRGLRWLSQRPEASEQLVLDQPPVTWRKVARADPGKLVRGVRSASTRLKPGLRLTVLDRLFPPGPVDHECRPYELGWLLYAWLPAQGGAR
ncbi:MAG TPA: hypothetical protein VG123_34145 [Streptosporangiaceae bacterium]|jgi:hypothetical protein|nr:hypothetical protein [Streptosporangiaceae bacterium]